MRWLRALPLVLAACAPMSVAQAERSCVDDARLAGGPRGAVAVGVGSGGPRAGIILELSTDSFSGRDPEEVFAACVRRKSGQLPQTPLSAQPGWKPRF